MPTADILVPIYNSYEETKNCIESILQHTAAGTYQLYLLDDHSPDPEIEKLTSYYAEKYKHIFSIRNEKNLGFPANVNNGFRQSANDAVVLNSDTLVTDGWLQALAETAYSQEAIAAVNPMSNYGSIAALPTQNMELNNLCSFQELTAAFQSCKEPGFLEFPTLIGFCMYIKRTALAAVGYFDAETFQRGYGEETDWCQRARRRGLKLVVAKGAYVHHIGAVSFGSEKEALRRKAGIILEQRYPGNEKELQQFIAENHFKPMRKKMLKELKLYKKQATFLQKIKILRHYLINFF
ncbi:glycosyltransferase [Bacillaceae bacterium Marseille-Q3522]|nr:glycosyltransferase [Bacillaceae bacterium Marseille-Q3522]